jgi:ribosomal protein S18 acetylase RimI-like enzyme
MHVVIASQCVVDPCRESDQVRLEVDRRGHLLRHDLRNLPRRTPVTTASGVTLRRGTARHVPAVLDLDNRAFVGFWQFDAPSLADARNATPTHRFRVALSSNGTDAEGRDPRPVGYAVTGRARRTAYLQRLAVDPPAQGCGLGALLVIDALRWSTRRGADHLLVNTQADNHAALRLYLRLGFTAEPSGLDVLVWSA